jgi:hypothetical protein
MTDKLTMAIQDANGTAIAASDRVELHPATDLWMRGARFGTVDRIESGKVWVQLDKVSGKRIAFNPDDLTVI